MPGPLAPGAASPRASHVAERTVVAVAAIYVIAVSVLRFHHAWDPWAAEGDWRQWLWTAWRQHDSTLLPATGDQLLADYLTAMHPPLYRLLLGALSTLLTPMHAAVVIGAIAWALLMGALVGGLRRVVGAGGAAVVCALVAHDLALFEWSGGGYPRSFGPAAVALFLAAFLAGRHRVALAILVVAAGLYPSVVAPCGLCIGVWTVGRGVVTTVDTRVWRREVLELFVAGGLIVVLGLWQNWIAPSWWGGVVHAADVDVALTAAGRCTWWPHPPAADAILHAFSEPFQAVTREGRLVGLSTSVVGLQVWLGALATVCVGVVGWRSPGRLPWRLMTFVGAVLVMYAAARVFAFQLYYPKRIIQHTLPIVAAVGLVDVVVAALDTIGVAVRRRLPLLVLLVVMPVVLLLGDGLVPSRIFRDRTAMKPLMTWVQTTDPDARFAGDLEAMDWIPLLGQRHVYANFTLAHPFRAGFFAVVRTRIEAVYDAIYADDFAAVDAFFTAADVDYLVVDTRGFARLEGGFGHLFEPMRSVVEATMFQPRRGHFVLAAPPPAVVAFQSGSMVVIDRQAVSALVAARTAP